LHENLALIGENGCQDFEPTLDAAFRSLEKLENLVGKFWPLIGGIRGDE